MDKDPHICLFKLKSFFLDLKILDMNLNLKSHNRLNLGVIELDLIFFPLENTDIVPSETLPELFL